MFILRPDPKCTEDNGKSIGCSRLLVKSYYSANIGGKKKVQTGYGHWSFSLALILGGKSRKAKEQTQDPQLLCATRGLVIVM